MAIGGGGALGAMIQGMPKKGQEQFDAADTNEDGIVSMAEFLQSVPIEEVDSTKATERFSKLDTDGDGNISQQEQDKTMQVRQAGAYVRNDEQNGGCYRLLWQWQQTPKIKVLQNV
jgi:Ca2+-binding EF-hand superfamily protein